LSLGARLDALSLRCNRPSVVLVTGTAGFRLPVARLPASAQLASDDEFTCLVAERCEDNAYANAFGKALLRAD
jgi:hypothetical protein